VRRRLRFEGVLPAPARELVVLVVAAAERSPFEWAAHAPIARSLGVPSADVDALAAGRAPGTTDPVERAAWRLARALVDGGDADDATWEAVHPVLGDAGVVEVSTTVGVYRLLAQQLRLFRVPAPPGPW
jgi:4-carboxymuconolactone decarboxylase